MELSQSVQQGLALAGSSAFTDKAAGVMANYATRAALSSEDLSAWEGDCEIHGVSQAGWPALVIQRS